MEDAERNDFLRIISFEIHSLSMKCKKANAIGLNEPENATRKYH